MKSTCPNLQVHIHGIDGSIASFTQNDPELVNRTLDEFDPAQILTQTRINIAGNHSVTKFVPPLITRIDLITDRLSVWDFPFAIGALMELAEAEFREHIHDSEQRARLCAPGNSPVFLDIEMVSGQRSFLWMEIVAGSPANEARRIHSLLKERSLIFGLRTCGIGVLNLANMVHCSVHPDSLEEATNARPTRQSHTLPRTHVQAGNSSRHLTAKG